MLWILDVVLGHVIRFPYYPISPFLPVTRMSFTVRVLGYQDPWCDSFIWWPVIYISKGPQNHNVLKGRYTSPQWQPFMGIIKECSVLRSISSIWFSQHFTAAYLLPVNHRVFVLSSLCMRYTCTYELGISYYYGLYSINIMVQRIDKQMEGWMDKEKVLIPLTHWGAVMHICVGYLTIIG